LDGNSEPLRPAVRSAALIFTKRTNLGNRNEINHHGMVPSFGGEHKSWWRNKPITGRARARASRRRNKATAAAFDRAVAFGKTISVKNAKEISDLISPGCKLTSPSPRLRGEGRDEGTFNTVRTRAETPHPDPLPARSGAREKRAPGPQTASLTRPPPASAARPRPAPRR
jgi:hypothetical protein